MNNHTFNENFENAFMDIPIGLRHLKRPSPNPKKSIEKWIA